jgi:hypothetical protein
VPGDPVTEVRLATYWEWARAEASLIDTDGCSKVSGIHVECCYEHDLSFFAAKDPRDAYLRWRLGDPEPWKCAKPITFGEANRRFRKCHQARSKFGMYSPMAWFRWLGVKFLSKQAWDKHRKREMEDKGKVS